MRFLELVKDGGDGQQEVPDLPFREEVPEILSATGMFVNANSQFRLEPAAHHIAHLLRCPLPFSI
jgi:hypothetical protein